MAGIRIGYLPQDRPRAGHSCAKRSRRPGESSRRRNAFARLSIDRRLRQARGRAGTSEKSPRLGDSSTLETQLEVPPTRCACALGMRASRSSPEAKAPRPLSPLLSSGHAPPRRATTPERRAWSARGLPRAFPGTVVAVTHDRTSSITPPVDPRARSARASLQGQPIRIARAERERLPAEESSEPRAK